MNEHVKTHSYCLRLPVYKLSTVSFSVTWVAKWGGLRARGFCEPESQEEKSLRKHWGRSGQEIRKESDLGTRAEGEGLGEERGNERNRDL